MQRAATPARNDIDRVLALELNRHFPTYTHQGGIPFSSFQEARMGLKSVVPALIGAVLLAAGSFTMADEYRADEYLGLDLSKAVLSPKPLGPATHFAPVAVEAKGDMKSDRSEVNWARHELKTEPKKVAVQDVKVTSPRRVTHTTPQKLAAEKPKGVARIKLAQRHRTNPLDAQAMDTRIQKWPCRSGGICDWKQ
jgi:hypothetical protein